jgi:hypothetical protein
MDIYVAQFRLISICVVLCLVSILFPGYRRNAMVVSHFASQVHRSSYDRRRDPRKSSTFNDRVISPRKSSTFNDSVVRVRKSSRPNDHERMTFKL